MVQAGGSHTTHAKPLNLGTILQQVVMHVQSTLNAFPHTVPPIAIYLYMSSPLLCLCNPLSLAAQCFSPRCAQGASLKKQSLPWRAAYPKTPAATVRTLVSLPPCLPLPPLCYLIHLLLS